LHCERNPILSIAALLALRHSLSPKPQETTFRVTRQSKINGTLVCASPCWFPKPPTAAARPDYGGRARRRWRRDSPITCGRSKRCCYSEYSRGRNLKRGNEWARKLIVKRSGIVCLQAGKEV